MVGGLTSEIAFYSTLAQTSASIVGLVGAVLVSQIIAHVAVMRSSRRELAQRVDAIYLHFNDRIEHWKNFKKYLEQRILIENSLFEIGSSAIQPTPTIAPVNWESSKSVLAADVQSAPGISNPEEDLKLLEIITPVYHPFAGKVKNRAIRAYASRLRETVALLPPDSKAAHVVLQDAILLERFSNRISVFRLKLFPRPFVIILLVLGLLSIAGILWPLAMLPGFGARSNQTYMLILLGIGIFSLIGYFAYQLRELTQLGSLSWKKPHH